MFKIEKYSYSCDGGCLTIASNKDTYIGLFNDYGDGEHTLYIVRAPGWGPAFYKNQEEYEQYEKFLKGWERYEITLCHETKNPTIYKALFYDCDDYEADGIVLEGFYFAFYHRLVKGGDAQIAIVCYQR